MPTRRSPSYYSSRTRSRTRSPHAPHSRGRSRTPDSRYSDRSYYSDSFHSDNSRGRGRRSRSRTPPRRRAAAKSKVVIPKFKGGGKKSNGSKPLKKSGAATSTPRPVGAQDVVTRRMLSARRLKINELRNEIDTLMKALDEIRRENKSLKRDNVLQNKQLGRLQDQEGELPQMIDSHSREVRTLKEQVRKWREKNERVSKSLRSTEDELSRSQRKIKRLQEIADDKKLEERDELSRRLGNTETDLETKTYRIQQLEKHIDNLEKSHRREIVIELRKHAALKLEKDTMQADLEYTKIHLRDREKELEVRNIYQNRIALAQRKGSVTSLPALEPPARYQPPPKSPEISPRHRAKQFEHKRREEQKTKSKELAVRSFDSPNSSSIVPPIKSTNKASEQPNKPSSDTRGAATLTQRQKKVPSQQTTEARPGAEKAKQSNYGAVKSEEPKPPLTPKFETENSWDAIVRKQQQISAPEASVTKDSLDNSFTTSFNKRLAEEQKIRERDEEERKERQRREEHQRAEALQRDNTEREKRDREERRRRDREEKERQDREDRVRQDSEDRDRDQREENERKIREERERYEREQQRKKREEMETKQREAQKAREVEDRERKYREDLESHNAEKEAEDRARIAREQEKLRLVSDEKAADERRKKDLLLQKMKDIDTGTSGTHPAPAGLIRPTAFGNSNDSAFGNSSGGDFFLTSGHDTPPKGKDYNFRKTDENLYRGLPAKQTAAKNTNLFADSMKDNSLFSPTKKGSLFTDNDDNLDFGGYQPSSLGSSNKQLGSRAKLQAEDSNTWKVKGSDGGGQKKTNAINDLFGDQTKVQPSIFDDNDGFSSRKQQSPKFEKRTSFPWDNDTDKPTTPNKILPLRPRANHSTIHNKPTVRAIDDFDDDLEEVVL